MSLSKKIYNSPPRLVSPDNVTMEEDEGMITVVIKINHENLTLIKDISEFFPRKNALCFFLACYICLTFRIFMVHVLLLFAINRKTHQYCIKIYHI